MSKLSPYEYARAYGAGEQVVSRLARQCGKQYVFNVDLADAESRVLAAMSGRLQMLGQDQEETRMRSFIERFMVERVKEHVRPGHEQEDMWKLALDGKMAFKMAEQLARGERSDRERQLKGMQEKSSMGQQAGVTGPSGPTGAVIGPGPTWWNSKLKDYMGLGYDAVFMDEEHIIKGIDWKTKVPARRAKAKKRK